jgi:NTE family protein
VTPAPTVPARRRGLVLGAGGVLGAAWTIGALRALEIEQGIDPRTFQVVIGTSAGSVLAALVSSGLGAESLVNHQRGIVVEGDPQVDFDYDGEGALPPRPRFRMGSREILARALRNPRHVRLIPTLSALAPQGRGSIAPVGALVDSVAPPEWPRPPQQPRTWIVALDYRTGLRVPFGKAGAPPARLADAVMASCAIPGWYAPIEIGGRPYVDGGAWSSTSMDLLAASRLDEVYCLAPMAYLESDHPRSMLGRAERRVRRLVTRRMLHEAEEVRAAGAKVTMLAPVADDLRAIGVNMMDSRRRELVLETSLRTSAMSLRAGDEPLDLASVS